ncbi:tyrosine-protein phosphatase [Lacticaseibacillus parakribbianus]|uniref:tyrosine-protein phosphatase n=1 Tax=Lacticaseibacillus parakribbianus TaxID=2970927 RepID=UPI0021CAE4FA|nr:tyrosine-protein phosphatase [Lacticaseibacillus parakribbianus]
MTPQRLLPIPNAVNLRELGGYRTKDGRRVHNRKLLRSGSLAMLDTDEAKQLYAYGLRHVVDLRGLDERAGWPDVLAPGVAYHVLSVLPFADTAPLPERLSQYLGAMQEPRIAPMAEYYLRMLTDAHALAQWRALFDLVATNTTPNEAVLFHCAAGKDRTGVAAMMLLGMLGVPEGTIRQDYLLTNAVFAAPAAQVTQALQDPGSTFVADMNRNRAEVQCQLAVAAFIRGEYGDWPRYVARELGVDAAAQTVLRDQLLTAEKNC